MATIWKYNLEAKDFQVLKLPPGAKILSVQSQPYLLSHGAKREMPRLWAMIENGPHTEDRLIRMIETGHGISADLAPRLVHLGTVQFADGPLVFHFFEELPA